MAVSSSFPETTFEDAGDVGGDRAGEMGSPLATEGCLTFNHNVQYLDFVSRNRGGVMKRLCHDVLTFSPVRIVTQRTLWLFVPTPFFW